MAKEKFEKKDWCCSNKGFPTFAIILLVVGIVWFLNELDIFPWANIPWVPLVLIIIAIGMIINRYSFRE